jgi:AGCS family alanine or glycine:cation symporter
MYYIKNGLKGKWNWLATAFAFFGASNARVDKAAPFSPLDHAPLKIITRAVIVHTKIVSAIILTLLSAIVILGGISRIAEVASSLVPIMAISYI